MQGIIAGGAAALTRSQEGAEDRPGGARDDLDSAGVRAGDFVIGIAASGNMNPDNIIWGICRNTESCCAC